MKLSAVVLAAGASRRAGGANKLLARDLSGEPMIVRTVGVAMQSQASDVAVVLGHDRAAVAACMEAAGLRPGPQGDGQRLHLLQAHDHAEGIAASLRCGIAWAAGSRSDAALVCLGDMPLVRPATLDRLMRIIAADEQALACVPLADGKPGNPVLWRSALFEALLALSGDRGGKLLLQRHAADVRSVAVDDPGILEDFDTPDRLAAYALC